MGSDRLTKSHRRKETGANQQGAARDQDFSQQSQKRGERWGYGMCFEGVMSACMGR